ncbi:MAG: hypothetical protein AAF438_13525 [Pseudomonadota bacterium]
MFTVQKTYSLVTGILPNRTANQVLDHIISGDGAHALQWHGRGTLVYDGWRRAWMPALSPAKSVFQMVVPDDIVSGLVDEVIEVGKLHQQATGAIFSSHCENAYFGSDFHVWPSDSSNPNKAKSQNGNLSVIYCIVSRQLTEKIGRAAIDAGAHGPIVYYAEGRGLRDRLGWLRITKEREKEVLMVVCDDADAEGVFEAMDQAGELHLPGRGFMYRLNVQTGMFNLPSRMSTHHYKASMQQIIDTIDHLAGHTHWRDQSAFDVGAGRGTGKQLLKVSRPILTDQVAISTMVRRSQMTLLMDLLLDAGAPGLNLNYGRFVAKQSDNTVAGARVNDEYGLLRCVTNQPTAEKICSVLEQMTEHYRLTDLCVLINQVPTVATYVPGEKDYRSQKSTPPSAGTPVPSSA